MEVESRWTCPVCGERRLALEELPNIGAVGVQPLSDLIGMGDPTIRALPEIVCLNCGSRWPSPPAYWAAVGSATPPDPARHPATDSEPGDAVEEAGSPELDQ